MNETEKKSNKKLRMALVRALSAFLVAVILLAVTGFSFIDLIKGPKESESIQNEEIGTFAKRDIFAILGFYADNAKGEDNVKNRYAMVPMGGELVTVRFSNRYLESAQSVLDSTYDFVNGKITNLDKYVVVQGTVEKLSEEESAFMYDWFGLNKDQLVEMRMIADTEDYAEILSDYVLVVDTVNYKSQNLVFALTGLAALFLLYAIVELVLMACGFYLDKPKKELAECGCGHEGCGEDGCEEFVFDDDAEETEEDIKPDEEQVDEVIEENTDDETVDVGESNEEKEEKEKPEDSE